jgi:hypothetical protein
MNFLASLQAFGLTTRGFYETRQMRFLRVDLTLFSC